MLRTVKNIDLAVACAALAVVVISVAWGVITRYILPQPATWTTELSSIAFAWVVFFGGSAAMRRGLHIGIPLAIDLLPPPARKIVSILASALVAIFLGYVVYLAWVLASQSGNRPSPVLRISFFYVYAGVALALFITFVHAVIQFARVIVSTDGTITYPDGRPVEER